MEYYRLLHHCGRNKLQYVSDYEADDFDVTAFWRGEHFNGSIPSSVKLFLSHEPHLMMPDLVNTPLSWWIVSDRFYGHIHDLIEKDVQCLSAPLFRGDKHVSGYTILNPLCMVHCIDEQSSTLIRNEDGEILYDDGLVISGAEIGLHHMFRMKDYEGPIMVSGEFVNRIRGQSITGVGLQKCRLS